MIEEQDLLPHAAVVNVEVLFLQVRNRLPVLPTSTSTRTFDTPDWIMNGFPAFRAAESRIGLLREQRAKERE